MRFLRHGPPGNERPGVVDGAGVWRDLTRVVEDITTTTVTGPSLDRLRTIEAETLPTISPDTRLGPPLGDVNNFYAVGFNYRDHAAETDTALPDEPLIFNKATSCVAGPYDPLVIPDGMTNVDWEVELGLVIGSPTYQVSESEALSVVAGYLVVNDVSERRLQLERGGQFVKGKSAPGFGPLGPYLATPDDVPDPQALRLWLDLNDRPMQRSATSQMIFGCAYLVSYLSSFLRLVPGDIVTTGTPSGVGMSQATPRFLRHGDRLTLGVEHLGEQTYEVTAAASA